MQPTQITSGPATRIRSETSSGSLDKDLPKLYLQNRLKLPIFQRQDKGSRKAVSERQTVLHTRFCSLSKIFQASTWKHYSSHGNSVPCKVVW